MERLTGNPDNVIQLWSRNGPCNIQLMTGDITKLPVEDKVSLIMVSAFPGDYSPVSGTVIGALSKNLGISVDRLSRDKELDLRKHFCCWLSKPIDTPDSPYKRLLCLEMQRVNRMTLTDTVRQMFRMFFPVFQNEENTVITPLLGTGNQGHDPVEICKCMVDAAAYWINAGLPLRAFKIVIYRNTSAEDSNLKSLFNKMRTYLMKDNQRMKNLMVKKNFDIYVLFSTEDEKYQQQLTATVMKKKKDVTITKGTELMFNKNKVWQDHIFNKMITCKRLVALLSPSFLEKEECMEQYNMALCCNRLMGFNVLIPIYIVTITNLPTYMGLVQWIDSRVRKEGDTEDSKLKSTVGMIVESLDTPMPDIALVTDNNADNVENVEKTYDVFISYSHKNPADAESLLKQFNETDPDLTVFYDRSSLTTGSNWQHLLYHCLGECRCVIMLLSPHYLSSIVCNEEFNLALAKYLSQDKDTQLVPVMVEEIEKLPESMSGLKVIDFTGRFKSETSELVNAVCKWLNGDKEKAGKFICPVKTPVDLEYVLSPVRNNRARQQYQLEGVERHMVLQRNPPLHLTPRPQEQYIPASQVDIAAIYSRESVKFVTVFCNFVDELYPDLNISLVTEDNVATRLKALDEAKKIVAFVSEELLESEQHMNELHMALCRQRSTTSNLLYLVQTSELIGRPFFPRILPYQVSLMDPVWEELKQKNADGSKSIMSQIKAIKYNKRLPHVAKTTIDIGHYFAMTKVAEDILESHIEKRDDEKWMPQTLLNILTVDQQQIKDVRPEQTKEQQPKPVTNHGDDFPIGSHNPDKQVAPAEEEAVEKDEENSDDNSESDYEDDTIMAGEEVNIEHKKRAERELKVQQELEEMFLLDEEKKKAQSKDKGSSKACKIL